MRGCRSNVWLRRLADCAYWLRWLTDCADWMTDWMTDWLTFVRLRKQWNCLTRNRDPYSFTSPLKTFFCKMNSPSLVKFCLFCSASVGRSLKSKRQTGFIASFMKSETAKHGTTRFQMHDAYWTNKRTLNIWPVGVVHFQHFRADAFGIFCFLIQVRGVQGRTGPRPAGGPV